MALLTLALAATATFLEVSEREGSGVRRFLYDEENPTRTLNVATVAMEVDRYPGKNRQKVVSFVHRIVREHPEVELLVFGEAILGWFYSPLDTERYQRQVSEPVPGPTTDAISALASEYQVYITFGMTEMDGAGLFNSQVLIGPDGNILTVQRKKNLKSQAFSPGATPVTFVDMEGVLVALVVCFDIQSQETRSLALDRNPDLLVLSNADWTEPWDTESFAPSYQARRFRTWIVSANRLGQEGEIHWDGHIEIVNPFGDIRASGSSREHFLYHQLAFDQDPSQAKAFLRAVYSTASLIYFSLKHLHTAFGYVTDGSPLRAWAVLGSVAVSLPLVLILLARFLGRPRSSPTRTST
jgi:predicted amidohydrolase